MWKHLFMVILSSLILFTMGAVDTYDQIKADSLNAHKKNSATTGLSGLVTSNTDSWTTGGPYGGNINSLAMAGTNPDIVYAGTDRGVFATTDGGATWTKTGFPETWVRVVQVAPDNPDIVYAGTDDGIYKSDDGGINWTQRNGQSETLSGARINAIAIDPQNHEILYAGTGQALKQPTGEITGIFKSINGGETWQLKLSAELDAVASLLIDTDNSSHIYAGVRPWGSASDGFCKSMNWGETWACKDITTSTADEVGALAMSPAGFNPPVIYAVGGLNYLYKSNDRGESWTRTNYGYHFPWVLAVDPNDPDVVYAGTGLWRTTWPVDEIYNHSEVHKSTDGGFTWSKKDNGLPEGSITSIVIDPRNSDVYIGLDSGGVYKSTDGAESWNISSQGMNNTWIYGLSVHPTYSDTVFAAIRGGGHHLAATTNGGTSWDYLLGSDSPTNLGAVAIDPQSPSTIYVGDGVTYFGSVYVYKSTNGGQSWISPKDKELFSEESYFARRVFDIWVHPSNSSVILAAVATTDLDVGGVFRSTNGGESWQQTAESWATTLAAHPTDPNILYFGTVANGHVWESTDGGTSWAQISLGGYWVYRVYDIEVDLNSHVYAATSSGLMKWDGADWTELTGLPTDDMTALAIDRSTSPGIVYVGTEEGGVFVSEDGGSTWTLFNEGLGNLSITKLAISASQPKMLYAGTAYGGVWQFTLAPSVYEIYLPLTLKNY